MPIENEYSRAYYLALRDAGRLKESGIGIDRYTRDKEQFYETLMPGKRDACMISEVNWMVRKDLETGESLGILVEPGDIVWLDYGRAYSREMGFQHFGLILTICGSKALIVPVTSSKNAYEHAYDEAKNPKGSRYLMRIGTPQGLKKESTLYLNDIRFINTARIIELRGWIPAKSELFQRIQNRIMGMLNRSMGKRNETTW